MSVTIPSAEAATRLLEDSQFREQWDRLFGECPWASVFQNADYLGPWYRVYADVFEPMLVVSVDASGQLDGLLPLAVEKSGRRLSLAGRPHAEYYAWLSRYQDRRFIEAALDSIAPVFPGAELDFRYLPPGMRLDHWPGGSRWKDRAVIEVVQRPLIDVRCDPEPIKGAYRTKLNRLNRLGTLEFGQVSQIAEIESDLDAIVDYCDFRQAAADRPGPFRSDPRKLPFYRALFEVPGLLHATVCRLNGRAISAHIGYRDKTEVSLGVLAHSPFFNRHSPGALHILQLARLLGAQGVDAFDLTPQGAYKERFATRHDSVTRLTVHFSTDRLRTARRQEALLDVGRRGLKVLSITPDQARAAARRARHYARQAWRSGSVAGAAAAFRAFIGRPSPLRVLQHDGSTFADQPLEHSFSRDSLDHLLA